MKASVDKQSSDKQSLRTQRQTFRKQLGERKAPLDQALLGSVFECLEHFDAVERPIAAYSPLPSEPGAPDFPAQLAAHASQVWLPISLAQGRLAWALHETGVRQGALGISEPAGPRFNSNVLRSCALVLAPALAVDCAGMRLGKGAGYYDRALRGLDVPVAAVVYDEDVVDRVPHDPHDVGVDAVITPAGFFTV